MDGNIFPSDTKGAYQTCPECRRGVVGPCWQWTEEKRLYFCSSEHAQEFQARGGFRPKPEEPPEPDEAVAIPKKPGRIKRWWRSLNDG